MDIYNLSIIYNYPIYGSSYSIIPHLVGGFSLPLWKMMEFVSWDDDIPNICNNKIRVPNHQPDMYIYGIYTVMVP